MTETVQRIEKQMAAEYVHWPGRNLALILHGGGGGDFHPLHGFDITILANSRKVKDSAALYESNS